MVSRFSFRFSLFLGQLWNPSSCISNFVISKSYRIYQGYQNILKRNADGILNISDYSYIGSLRNHLKPDFTYPHTFSSVRDLFKHTKLNINVPFYQQWAIKIDNKMSRFLRLEMLNDITKRAIVRPKLPQNIKSNMLPPDTVLSEALSHFIFPSDVYFIRPKHLHSWGQHRKPRGREFPAILRLRVVACRTM